MYPDQRAIVKIRHYKCIVYNLSPFDSSGRYSKTHNKWEGAFINFGKHEDITLHILTNCFSIVAFFELLQMCEHHFPKI